MVKRKRVEQQKNVTPNKAKKVEEVKDDQEENIEYVASYNHDLDDATNWQLWLNRIDYNFNRMCPKCSKSWWRKWIEDWLEKNEKCPNCCKTLKVKYLTKNIMFAQIMDTLDKRKGYKCQSHNEEAELYWVTCKKLLWFTWNMEEDGTHATHRLLTPHMYLREQKKNLLNNIEIIKDFKTNLEKVPHNIYQNWYISKIIDSVYKTKISEIEQKKRILDSELKPQLVNRTTNTSEVEKSVSEWIGHLDHIKNYQNSDDFNYLTKYEDTVNSTIKNSINILEDFEKVNAANDLAPETYELSKVFDCNTKSIELEGESDSFQIDIDVQPTKTKGIFEIYAQLSKFTSAFILIKMTPEQNLAFPTQNWEVVKEQWESRIQEALPHVSILCLIVIVKCSLTIYKDQSCNLPFQQFRSTFTQLY